MKHNLAVDFSVDKENKTIEVKREFAAERSLVWDAYTKQEILDQWWAPKPWKAKTKSMDFKEGGVWLYAMVSPEGEEHWAIVDYTKIQVPELFAGLDAFTDKDGNIKKEMPRSKWEVSFEDKDEHTEVKIHISYDDLAQLEATIAMGFKEGLSMAMENLDELLPTFKNK
ncbi:SRPBCC family protein [Fluviicola sp.]|uniref:SRPBCC family protein n=1 Tax=Fluviicola sp. TaxID=1917219 RepID=UPI003D26FF25